MALIPSRADPGPTHSYLNRINVNAAVEAYHVFRRSDEFDGGVLDLGSFVWLSIRSADWVVHKLLWNYTHTKHLVLNSSLYFVCNSLCEGKIRRTIITNVKSTVIKVKICIRVNT